MKKGVRFAKSDSELRACYQLRHKIYVEGMGRFVDKGNHTLKELEDDLDKNARAIIAVKKDTAIGTLRLFWGGDSSFTQEQATAYHLSTFKPLLKEDKICIAERLMIDDKHRGSMTALRMYKEVMDFVLKQQIEVVLLDCEIHHLKAYLKLGFKPFSKQYNYPGVGPVIPMALVVGDYQHLQKIGSPFATLLPEEALKYCKYSKILKDTIFLDHEEDHQFKAHKNKIMDNFQKTRNKLLTQRSGFFEARLREKLYA